MKMASPTGSQEEKGEREKVTTLVVHGKELQLNPFVDRLFQRVILALISTLHAPELTGTEKVRIEISK